METQLALLSEAEPFSSLSPSLNAQPVTAIPIISFVLILEGDSSYDPTLQMRPLRPREESNPFKSFRA